MQTTTRRPPFEVIKLTGLQTAMSRGFCFVFFFFFCFVFFCVGGIIICYLGMIVCVIRLMC
jgi:hypothetical protein